jgi:hypothetical protein
MKSALVLISHYNAWPAAHLVSLLDQARDIPSGHPFRCLVVVNRAIDRDLELPERHRGVEILYRENTGYNIGAWEFGWRTAAPADYYLFLQEECRIMRPDWLGSSIRRLSRPTVGLIGESMAWTGQDWPRVAYLHLGHPFHGAPDEPPIDHIGGVRRFLQAKGIPFHEQAEHLQSLILATRRDVLEAIDGFRIGGSKGDAIACEVAISQAVASRGWKVQQAGLLPFRYILHPQWAHLNKGVFTLLQQGVERYAPLPTVSYLRKQVYRMHRYLTGKPYDWEIPEWEATKSPATAQGTHSR